MIEDITDLKNTHQRLRQSEHELAHASRLNAMGEMATGIAHEIDQLLGVILNYATVCSTVLSSGHPDLDQLSHMVDQIINLSKRAGQIVNQIRRFVSRPAPALSSVGLNELVHDTLDLLEYDIRRSHINLEIDLCDTLPVISVDRIQIMQVILNLLRNAIEAVGTVAADKRRIAVRLLPSGDQSVECQVADSGPGIKADLREQAFEPFFTTKPGGMGMGLAISRRIVEACGGRLWCGPNPSGGAIF